MRACTCDVCGAAAGLPDWSGASDHRPMPEGWRRIHLFTGPPETIEQRHGLDVCSPDCLRVWAQRAAEAWAQAQLAERQTGPCPATSGSDPARPCERRAGHHGPHHFEDREPRTPVGGYQRAQVDVGPWPKPGTLVHGERDAGPGEGGAEAYPCPVCGAAAGARCTFGNGSTGVLIPDAAGLEGDQLGAAMEGAMRPPGSAPPLGNGIAARARAARAAGFPIHPDGPSGG